MEIKTTITLEELYKVVISKECFLYNKEFIKNKIPYSSGEESEIILNFKDFGQKPLVELKNSI